MVPLRVFSLKKVYSRSFWSYFRVLSQKKKYDSEDIFDMYEYKEIIGRELRHDILSYFYCQQNYI